MNKSLSIFLKVFSPSHRYLPKEDYVIQVWCGGYDYWISDLLRKGYRVIFSNSDAWYLNKMIIP